MPLSHFHVLLDAVADCRFVGQWCFTGIGHPFRKDQLHLRPIVEGAADFFFRRFRQSQPLPDERKTLPTHGESGTGQNHRVHFIEKLISQDRPHINWSRDQFDPLLILAARFEPIDSVFDRLLQP